MSDEHCGDDNCLCHGDRRHRTGWCEPPWPAGAGLTWTCPECGAVKESFCLGDGSMEFRFLVPLVKRGYDPNAMYGWRGKHDG